MKSNSTILFIGNFLSKVQGTIGPTEYMADRFREDGRNIIIASTYSNKFLRLADMVMKTMFYRYDSISIDVYSSTALKFARITSILAKIRKKKIVLVLHGGGLVDVYKRKKDEIESLLNRATFIVTPSHFLKSFFVSMGYEVSYISNTIDLKVFNRTGKTGGHRLLWVRAFTKNYNPDIAVRVLYEVLQRFPDATLTMVGPDKGNLDEIQQLINELDLRDKITITGRIENKKLPKYYNSHNVYLNTTSYESFGVALIEAAACGLPIVSTSVGEIPIMWRDGTDILLSEAIEPTLLADKVLMLFDDDNMYAKIAENAYVKAQSYSWESVSKEWNNVFFE